MSMPLPQRVGILITSALLMVSIQSCLVATEKTLIVPTIETLFEGDYTIDPFMDTHKPRVVAVMPFIDLSNSKEGFETVRKGFYNHFSSLPYSDIELYRIDDLLKKAGLADPDVIRKTPPQELGKLLHADAVVLGTISDFDKFFAVVYSQVAVGAAIEMYDTTEGHLLWSGTHVARIHEGGISTTPVGLVATIIATSLNMRDIQLLRACDDLFRDMVKTIPLPSISEMHRPPVITMLAQDTKNRPLKAGAEIKVVLQGTPGRSAYFDIGEYVKGIEMQEIEPGGYLGTYRIVPGDNVEKAIVTGHLHDDKGETARWIDAIGTVTIDTTPPSKPEKVTVVGRDRVVLLAWNENVDADVAAYHVYRSMTPISGYEQVADTEFTNYQDMRVTNNQQYFYRITTLDFAGNESDVSVTGNGIPVSPGPTIVSGVIESNTRWYSGASPYVLGGEIRIRDGSTLTIEPGTIIESEGAAIVVEGTLHAVGDDAHSIQFNARNDATWEGMVFKNVTEKENMLRNCRISGASTGVTCSSSSPIIDACEITNNEIGVLIAGSFSKPTVHNCIIAESKQGGICVEDGASPFINGNKISGNEGGGIVIRNAGPMLESNTIIQNKDSGIHVTKSTPIMSKNSIYGNEPFNVVNDGEIKLNARENWWGTTEGRSILSTIQGKIDISIILTAPYPEGVSTRLPILGSDIPDLIISDSFLILSESPYRVVHNVMIDNGATLYAEPGVCIQYDQGTLIEVKKGGIVAQGTSEHPIEFTASGSSPSPGFYMNAVRFSQDGHSINSSFEYCIFEYAVTAIDIFYGMPDISHCYIANNSQSGIYCRNDAAAKISYSTFMNNLGMGAIQCVGLSRPLITRNNFDTNVFAIQAFSSICIDARNNWWGMNPPEGFIILKEGEDSIIIDPWLTEPERNAFLPRQHAGE